MARSVLDKTLPRAVPWVSVQPELSICLGIWQAIFAWEFSSPVLKSSCCLWEKPCRYFFQDPRLHHGSIGLMELSSRALSHLSHGDQQQRKQQTVGSMGWKRGRWHHRPLVRDWGKGICQDRKIPGICCLFPAMNSTFPASELVSFSFFLLLSFPCQPVFWFFFSQAGSNTFGLFLIHVRVLRGAKRKQSHFVLVVFLMCSKK